MSGWRRIGVVVGAALLLASCGGISRAELDEEIHERGGGLGSTLPLAAVDALEAELGVDDLVVRSMSVNVSAVTTEVLVPDTNRELDSYIYNSNGELSDPDPVAGVGPTEELRRELFRISRVALDDLDEMVDEAIDEADLEGGYAQTISIDRPGRRVTIAITVTNPRDTVRVEFNAGRLEASGMNRFVKWLIVLGSAFLLALFIAVMLMVAYPSSLKVGASILCPDDKPDAFVVRYNVQTSDGTGTNFTLFCMSERGEIEEIGTWEPLLVLFVFVAAIIFSLILLRVLWKLIRRITSEGDPGTGPPGFPDDPTLMTPEQILSAAPPPPSPPGENPFET